MCLMSGVFSYYIYYILQLGDKTLFVAVQADEITKARICQCVIVLKYITGDSCGEILFSLPS